MVMVNLGSTDDSRYTGYREITDRDVLDLQCIDFGLFHLSVQSRTGRDRILKFEAAHNKNYNKTCVTRQRQISLHIHPVWLEFSPFSLWIA